MRGNWKNTSLLWIPVRKEVGGLGAFQLKLDVGASQRDHYGEHLVALV
jgi:hypothetical protein